MTSLKLLLLIFLGIAIQVGIFLSVAFWGHWRAYARLKQGLPASSAFPAAEGTMLEATVAGWPGFRDFKVSRRVVEDADGRICSFYLEPTDGRPLPGYRPGQFLTFRLDVPKADGTGSEQVVRCYSLSDAPGADHYRITVKRVSTPPQGGHPPGRSSNFLHDRAEVGATLQVRAPSGHFHLAPDDAPIVLMAGGIGITPLLSMLNWCVAHQPGREVWFFYGVRNGREAVFARHLRDLAAAHPGLHLRMCFSDPRPEDEAGRDFQHRGRVDVNLLRMELPLKPYHFYICGPTPMMETLVAALEDWGVPDQRIHFEAFGPASIKRRSPEPAVAEPGAAAMAAEITVTFAKSGKRIPWSSQSGSLLEFAEANGIAIDSGCRAGGCGTCQTGIRSGEVAYRQTPDYDPEPGTCLMCVSTPRSNLTLEA